MIDRSLLDPRIWQIRAEQMRAYMLDHGWKIRPYPRPEQIVFDGPNDDDGLPILQTLPSSEKARDYCMRLVELLSSLCVFEDRSGQDILTEVLRYPVSAPTPITAIPSADLTSAPK
jgi:hypothetical protein